MTPLFQWLENVINWFGLFIPRRVIVRKTDKLIKFKYNGEVSEEGPGLRWYWPFTTEIEELTVVRQPLDIRSFSLVTKDFVPVVVDAVVVYKITNAIQFICENFDSYTAVSEVVSAALRTMLCQKTFNQIQESSSIGEELQETAQEFAEDFGVEIFYCRLQNFTYCLPVNLVNTGSTRKENSISNVID